MNKGGIRSVSLLGRGKTAKTHEAVTGGTKRRESSACLYGPCVEAKEAKEAEFQEGWKTMKQGKNKPLDEEEVEFLDDLEVQKREEDKKRREREENDIETFKLMRETMVIKAAPLRAGLGAGGSEERTKRPAEDGPVGGAGKKKPKLGVFVKPKMVPKFKAVPKGRQKSEEKAKAAEEERDDEGGGLGGLLGYGSASDND